MIEYIVDNCTSDQGRKPWFRGQVGGIYWLYSLLGSLALLLDVALDVVVAVEETLMLVLLLPLLALVLLEELEELCVLLLLLVLWGDLLW